MFLCPIRLRNEALCDFREKYSLAMGIKNAIIHYAKAIYHRISRKPQSTAKRVQSSTPLFPIISPEQLAVINSCIRITFTGDLILLKDMVQNGYNAENKCYSFDSMFSYVKPYYDEADYNIGVLEGPVAGAENGYSTSCFNDGVPIYLNFPKEYAESVYRTGFDMVSLANNHILDQGVDGLYHTLDVLDEVGLSHIGAYRNESEYERYSIVNIKGKKIALLAYTYGSNYYSTDFFYEKEHRHLTKVIVKPSDKHIDECLKSVQHDFEVVKQMSPDAIFVLPHMGKQFRHEPDDFQNYWCNVFVENGADVIFSDHPHAVQPIEWREINNKNILIVHCPGNFINSYTKKDGDASMIVECYLNSETGKPVASSCVPIYAYCEFDKDDRHNFIGIPIHTLVKNKSVSFPMGKYEYERVCDVQKLVTKVAIGEELPIDNVQDRYYYFPKQGYVRQKVSSTILLEGVDKTNRFIEMIAKGNRMAFVGDSITEGTVNGGYGWFEPLMANYKHKEWSRMAKGGATSQYFLLHKEDIANLNSDLFVLAFGCNDIRYRNENTCAMTASVSVDRLTEICDTILAVNKDANIVVVSPWKSQRFDPFCKLPMEDKDALYTQYDAAIKAFCISRGFLYCNPNPYIEKRLSLRDTRYYLKDHIHCNADEGIRLFSEAVVYGCEN